MKSPISRLLFTLIAIGLVATSPLARAQTTTNPASNPQPANTQGTPDATQSGDSNSTETSAAPAKPDPRFATPRATMFTFLEAINAYKDTARPEDLHTALACFDFSGVKLEATQREVAATLLNILNRIDTVAEWQFPDPTSDHFVYFPQDWITSHARMAALVPDARIVLEKQPDARWVFSAETVEAIPDIYRQVEDVRAEFGDGEIALTPAMVLRSKMPHELRQGQFLGVEYWQWIGIALLIFLGFLVDLSVRALLRTVWRRVERRRDERADRDLLDKAVRPFGLFACAVLWYLTLALLGLPPAAVKILLIAIKVILMLSGVWAAWRLTDLAADFLQRQANRTRTKLDDLLIPLARKTGKVLVAAFGLIYIAESFDVQILPLLTGLGIGGLAFAFAAKDTIENFFGSVAVILDQPFEVGDWVVIEGKEGTVEELGLRSTRIRTFYNSVITVPNSTLVRATVDNYGRRRYRRFKASLGVTYDTPPDRIEAFCEGIRELIRVHPYTRKDYFHVYLNSWGDFSLNVLLYMFFECPDWSVELRERHRLMLDIMRLADRLGVSFAFPTQTLELKRFEAPGDPAPAPQPHADTHAQRLGVEAAQSVTANASWHAHKPGPVTFKHAGNGQPVSICEIDEADGDG